MNTQQKILVADDDPAILDSLALMLEMAHYTVETCIDGAYVRTMKTNLPDLLLLDIWMSGEDGRLICRILKNQKQTKHIPIIMISANKDTEKMAKEAGADDFLSKPFEMDDLLEKIAKHINH